MNTTGSLGIWNSRCKEKVRAGGKMSVGCQSPEKKEDTVQKEERTPTDKTEDEGCPVGTEELLLEKSYLNVGDRQALWPVQVNHTDVVQTIALSPNSVTGDRKTLISA